MDYKNNTPDSIFNYWDDCILEDDGTIEEETVKESVLTIDSDVIRNILSIINFLQNIRNELFPVDKWEDFIKQEKYISFLLESGKYTFEDAKVTLGGLIQGLCTQEGRLVIIGLAKRLAFAPRNVQLAVDWALRMTEVASEGVEDWLAF